MNITTLWLVLLVIPFAVAVSVDAIYTLHWIGRLSPGLDGDRRRRPQARTVVRGAIILGGLALLAYILPQVSVAYGQSVVHGVFLLIGGLVFAKVALDIGRQFVRPNFQSRREDQVPMHIRLLELLVGSLVLGAIIALALYLGSLRG